MLVLTFRVGVQTGVIPLFVPFAQLFAAALTAALTGSMYYAISSPKGMSRFLRDTCWN